MTHPPPARPELDAASLFRVFSCVVFTLTLLGAVTGPVFAADCTFRYQVTGSIPNQAFGSAVATIGNVNGDGIPDFAVGAPGMPGTPTSPDPAVYVSRPLRGPPAASTSTSCIVR